MRSKELEDLITSAFLLTMAFGISFSGGFSAFFELQILLRVTLMCLPGVSSGFLLHELGHRFLARTFGYFAQYIMWPVGLMIALAASLVGFIFAAPGAVVMYPRGDISKRSGLTRQQELGLISIAGPIMNISLAVVFLVVDRIYPNDLSVLGARVNTWLAIFNLLPLGPLDGAEVFRWSKAVWIVTLMLSSGLFVLQYSLF